MPYYNFFASLKMPSSFHVRSIFANSSLFPAFPFLSFCYSYYFLVIQISNVWRGFSWSLSYSPSHKVPLFTLINMYDLLVCLIVVFLPHSVTSSVRSEKLIIFFSAGPSYREQCLLHSKHSVWYWLKQWINKWMNGRMSEWMNESLPLDVACLLPGSPFLVSWNAQKY